MEPTKHQKYPGRDHGPRVLVATGAASGIGLAICRAWRREDSGAVIVLLDRDARQLEKVKEELGDSTIFMVVDVRDSEAVNGVFAEIDRGWGRVDALVNSAGNSRPGPTAEISDEDWESVIDIHLNGTLRISRAAYPLLKRAGGAIVNLGSVASHLGMPGRASYNSAKHGLVGLTRSLAVEWAQDGIRVNAVGPGYVLTELTRKLIDAGELPTKPVIARTPLGRWADAGEIADGALFLLSDKATYITGHTLMIDGGMTIAGDWYSTT